MLADTGLMSIGAIRDHGGQALADVYFEDEPGQRSAAKLLTKDEAPGMKNRAAGAPRATSRDSLPRRRQAAALQTRPAEPKRYDRHDASPPGRIPARW